MRHVPMAEFKNRMAETIAAAEAGEEIVITRHGRGAVRLVPVEADEAESRRRTLVHILQGREALRTRGVGVSAAEIREWIDEGRR